ncbi:MAG: molybdopterin molybdotransferase MoeA [Chloroflexi bacterium]|nr:molybdopterin molybdotransferase MoeA [Chloroflexota bacterium]
MVELFNVLSPPDAYRVLESHLPVEVRTERVPIARALDRVLAEDLTAPADLPAFARSTMDGFAVRAADTYGASEGLPAYLSVVGEALMGVRPETRVGVGQAVRIATGGMLPEGADAVLMVEHTQEVDRQTIEVVRPVAPGENVLRVGEDVARGASVLPRGHALRPQDLGGLAALGFAEVAVARRLRVAIVSSGDELVPPDQVPGPGQIRDINTYTLAALVERAGHEPLALGIVPDDYDRLAAAARRALELGDVAILSAGSSVSTRDLTAQVIASLGQPGVLVHGVSLRPGKPTILAVARGKPVFGLPGNPVSCMVTFDLFVAPTLARLSGLRGRSPRQVVSARLAHNVASAPGREDYVQVRLEPRGAELWAVPVFGKSNLIYTLVRADGMIKVDLDKGGLSEGELVSVVLF